MRGFGVARLGDEVEYLLANILLDGEGADLLLDAADLLEGLLRALAPVGFARFVAASNREVILTIGVGQLLVGRLHLLELPRPGTVQLALCRGAVLLRGERAVVLLLGGGLLMREVDQPGAGDSLLIQLGNELAVGIDLLLDIRDLLVDICGHGGAIVDGKALGLQVIDLLDAGELLLIEIIGALDVGRQRAFR